MRYSWTGDETYDLIVMLDGTAEIVKDFGRPEATVIAWYGQSQFPGEIGMLTGQRACLRERTRRRRGTSCGRGVRRCCLVRAGEGTGRAGHRSLGLSARPAGPAAAGRPAWRAARGGSGCPAW